MNTRRPHAWGMQAHKHSCAGTHLRRPHGRSGAVGLSRQDSPDAVVVVWGGQLQGEARRHGWPRGQRLLLKDELGSQVHLGGAHHDLSSREQGRLPLVVVLQHLGTGRASWWRWWRSDHHMWGRGSRPGLSGQSLVGLAGPHSCSPPPPAQVPAPPGRPGTGSAITPCPTEGPGWLSLSLWPAFPRPGDG